MKSRAVYTNLLLTAGLVFVSVLLFFANRVPAFSEKKGQPEMNNTQASLSVVANAAVAGLHPEDKKTWSEIIEKSKSANSWLDSAIFFWDEKGRPDVAAIQAEKKATVTKVAEHWFHAGERYYNAVRFIEQEQERAALYQAAIASYEKGLQLKPNDVDARIGLASCFVEGSTDPMKGIAMLREIEKTDSNNVKLQMNFAFFSARSGQWDRAISRLNKVLKIDSTLTEVWLHLADAYEQNGQTDQSIRSLEEFVARTDDELAKKQINEVILQLKNRQAKTDKEKK